MDTESTESPEGTESPESTEGTASPGGIDGIEVETIDGRTTTLAEFPGQVRLVVNVASRCGFTPQYGALERLWQTYRGAGLMVLGFPTNQFLQELGDEEAIAEFCQVNYGVTFPMFAKVRVNGRHRHPVFAELTQVPDGSGKAGRVAWNFEKWLLLPGGDARRFRSTTEPDAPEVVALIEAALAP